MFNPWPWTHIAVVDCLGWAVGSWLRGEKMKTMSCCTGGDTEQFMSVVFSVSLESPDRNVAMEELLRE